MISKKIEEIIIAKSVSKKELSERIGVPLSTLSNKFKNNTFTAEELLRVKEALGVNLSIFDTQDLFGIEIEDLSRVKLDNLDTVSPIQFVNGDSITYVMAKVDDNDSRQFLCLEDWETRTEIVLRFRDESHLVHLNNNGFEKAYNTIPLREIIGDIDGDELKSFMRNLLLKVL